MGRDFVSNTPVQAADGADPVSIPASLVVCGVGTSLGEREPPEREKDRHPGTVLA